MPWPCWSARSRRLPRWFHRSRSHRDGRPRARRQVAAALSLNGLRYEVALKHIVPAIGGDLRCSTPDPRRRRLLRPPLHQGPWGSSMRKVHWAMRQSFACAKRRGCVATLATEGIELPPLGERPLARHPPSPCGDWSDALLLTIPTSARCSRLSHGRTVAEPRHVACAGKTSISNEPPGSSSGPSPRSWGHSGEATKTGTAASRWAPRGWLRTDGCP